MVQAADYNVLLMSPGNGLHKGQMFTWGKINGELTGVESPFERFPQLLTPDDYIPTSNGCSQQAVSSPQLISANFWSAAQVIGNMQLVLEAGAFYEEHFFDVYTGKMTANDSFTIKD